MKEILLLVCNMRELLKAMRLHRMDLTKVKLWEEMTVHQLVSELAQLGML